MTPKIRTMSIASLFICISSTAFAGDPLTILNYDGRSAEAFQNGARVPQVIAGKKTRFRIGHDPSAILGLGLPHGLINMPKNTKVTLHYRVPGAPSWKQTTMKNSHDQVPGRAFTFDGNVTLPKAASGGQLEYWVGVHTNGKFGAINAENTPYQNFTVPVVPAPIRTLKFTAALNNPADGIGSLKSGTTVTLDYQAARMAKLFTYVRDYFRPLPAIEAVPGALNPAADILWQIDAHVALRDAQGHVMSSQTLPIRAGKGDAVTRPDIYLTPGATSLTIHFNTSLSGEAAQYPREYGIHDPASQLPRDTNFDRGFVFNLE